MGKQRMTTLKMTLGTKRSNAIKFFNYMNENILEDEITMISH
jgi:hypothetical protein